MIIQVTLGQSGVMIKSKSIWISESCAVVFSIGIPLKLWPNDKRENTGTSGRGHSVGDSFLQNLLTKISSWCRCSMLIQQLLCIFWNTAAVSWAVCILV